MGRSGRGKAIKKQAIEKGWNRKTRKSRRKEQVFSPQELKRRQEKLLKKKEEGKSKAY